MPKILLSDANAYYLMFHSLVLYQQLLK